MIGYCVSVVPSQMKSATRQAIPPLAPIVLLQGGPAAVIDASAQFIGAFDTFSVIADTPAISIDAASGAVTIDTAQPLSTSFDVVATFGGGSLSVTYMLDITSTLPAPSFTAQPSLGAAAFDIGTLITLDEGAAGPAATLSIEVFTLDGVDISDQLSGLTWDSTDAPEGTLILQMRADNATGTVLSDAVTATLAAPVLALPSYSQQPALDAASYTVGDTVTLSQGVAGPAATITLEYLTLNGADISDQLSGLTWDSTDAPEGTLAYRTRATNATGSTLSNEVTATLAAAVLPAPSFTAQPSLGAAAFDIGTLITLDEGAAGPAATLSIEVFTLDGVDISDQLSGLTWDSTDAPEGTLILQMRADNATGTVLSDAVTATLAAPVVSTPGLAHVLPADWSVVPTGTAGDVMLTLPGVWRQFDGTYTGNNADFSPLAVSAVQYRWCNLDPTADPKVLNDPDGSWSAPIDCPTHLGNMVLSGLPQTPCAIQIRTEQSLGWGPWSTFKRVGRYFFGYHDTVQTLPGAIDWAVPDPVIWGTENQPGEAGQRVSGSAIVAGDPLGHFQIIGDILSPTAAGVAAWTGGESYALVLDDASTVTVEIQGNAVAIGGSENTHLASSVAEWQAITGRYAADNAASGKTFLIRPGFYDLKQQTDNPSRNAFWLNWADAKVTVCAADPAVPPMISGLKVTRNADPSKRNIRFENLQFFTPQRSFGVDTNGIGVDISNAKDNPTEAIEFIGCDFYSDGIEARYGFQIRGGLPRTQITMVDIKANENLHVQGCRFMDAYYAIHTTGADITFEDNLVTHVAADYINFRPDEARDCHVVVRNNRFREHTGDQSNIHADGWHIWNGGKWSGDVYGNIWFSGFEALACPGQVPAQYANQTNNISADYTVTAADIDTYLVVDTADGDVTLTIPDAVSLTAPFGFAVVKASDDANRVIMTGGDDRVIGKYLEKAIYEVLTSAPTVWTLQSSDKSFQGAPYQNNANVVYDDFRFHHNVVLGVSANSAALFGGLTSTNGLSSDKVPSRNILMHHNTFLPYLLEAADDLNGDGVVDGLDGVPNAYPNIRFGDGLRGWNDTAGTFTDDTAIGLSGYGNIAPKATDVGLARADVWAEYTTGDPRLETPADRLAVFAGSARNWRPTTSFAEAIEQARAKAGSVLDSTCIGAVGPTDDAAGFYDFTARALNAPRPIAIDHCFPQQGSLAMPLGAAAWLEFDRPVTAGAGALSLYNVTDGAGVPGTISVDGRRVAFAPDAPLEDGKTYDLLVTGSGITAWDDAALSLGTDLVAGDFRFTANAAAQFNTMATLDGSGNDQSDLFATDWVALSSAQRLDTNRLPDAERPAYLPTGPCTFVSEVESGSGSAKWEVRLFGTPMDATYSLTISRSTGAITAAAMSGLTQGTDYGVTPVTGGWRFWMAPDATGCTRYYVDLNKTDDTANWRYPLLVAGAVPDAPYVAGRYSWSAPA